MRNLLKYLFTTPRLFTLIFLLGSPWSDGLTGLAMGQTHGKIIGRIIDVETGDLLPSVNITLNNSTLGSSTNFKGEYFILGVPVGSHEIMVSFIGYSPVKVICVSVYFVGEANVQMQYLCTV